MKPRIILFFLLVLLVNPIQLIFAEDNLQQNVDVSPILYANTSFLNIRTGPNAGYGLLTTVSGGTVLPVLAMYENGVWYQVSTDAGVGWVNSEYTLAGGDFSNVPLVEFGELTTVGSNFVASSASAATATEPIIAISSNSVVSSVFASAVASGTPMVGLSIMGGDLYAQPNDKSTVVYPVVPADDNVVYPVFGTGYYDGRVFYQLYYPNYGIVWADQARLRPLNCAGQTVLRVTQDIGTMPIGNSPSLAFKTGDEMFFAGPGRDGYIEIATIDGVRGLLSVVATQPTASDTAYVCEGVEDTIDNSSPDETIAPAPIVNPGDEGVIIPVNLESGTIQIGASLTGSDLYAEPSPHGQVLHTLVPRDDNTVYPVRGVAYEFGIPFYQISHPTYGLVWTDKVRVRPLNCYGQTVIRATSTVGTMPIGNSLPIEFKPGDEMFIAGPTHDGYVDIVTVDGVEGYVPADKTEPTVNSVRYYCDPRPVATTDTSAQPTTTTDSAATTDAEQQDDILVTLPTSDAIMIVNTSYLNLRTGPSARFDILSTVSGGTVLPVTAVYEDFVWYQVATDDGFGWLNSEFTIARGDFAGVPLVKYGTLVSVNTDQTTTSETTDTGD
jgi:uncharacterized protein YgiM (DUF1202 family)